MPAVLAPCPRRRVCTTRASSTTPAAWPSSPTCTAGASHRIVAQALTALHNLDHRGAAGAEPSSGDGAGITCRCPDAFLRAVVGLRAARRAGAYAVGIAFLPVDDRRAPRRVVELVEAIAAEEGLTVLGWRERADRRRRRSARPRRGVMPRFRQLFVAGARRRDAASTSSGCAFALRKVAERRARETELELYFPSLSARTLVYKGMLTTDQLGDVLPRPDRRAVRQRDRAWCTAGSRPTRSRPGRWRTRSATSRTTARSTPSAATATGCAPARRCSSPTCIPGDLQRLFPICTPDASATRPPSTRCSNCCTWAAAACRTRC